MGREEQIVQRMARLSREGQSREKTQQKLKAQQKRARAKKLKETESAKGNSKTVSGERMPFVANPKWEAKKRTFSEFATDSAVSSGNASKKLKGAELRQSTLALLAETNPSKFVEENELVVVGVDAVGEFLDALFTFSEGQLETYYDESGADYIGCRWLVPADADTQRTLFSALWELGRGIVKNIKVLRCPSEKEIAAHQSSSESATVRKFAEMLNVTHLSDIHSKRKGKGKETDEKESERQFLESDSSDTDDKEMDAAAGPVQDDGWTLVDAHHNI